VKTILSNLGRAAKTVAAAVAGAVLPLLIVGFTQGFNGKAIVAAAGTSAASALLVYFVPNQTPPPAPKTTVRR
jgi:predicted membrane-bound mannosyltransferase